SIERLAQLTAEIPKAVNSLTYAGIKILVELQQEQNKVRGFTSINREKKDERIQGLREEEKAVIALYRFSMSIIFGPLDIRENNQIVGTTQPGDWCRQFELIATLCAYTGIVNPDPREKLNELFVEIL